MSGPLYAVRSAFSLVRAVLPEMSVVARSVGDLNLTTTRQGVLMAPSGKPAPERAGDRDKALEAALVQIERQFGKGSVMRLGEQARVPVDVIPTGSIALDVALGLGGLPRGRIVEIYGPESSGKTTVALHALANAQKAGGIAAFIDAEHALDPGYAQKLGVDTDALLVSQPDTGEQALEIMDMLIRSGAIDVVVIDSVAALVPKAEIEGEMGDSHVGLQARLMSQALRKITGALSQTKTTAIFINQLREKVGVMFGSPETTSGGKALKFYASVRLDIRRIETLKDGTESVGNRTRVKVVKNKLAPPFRNAEFDILYGVGISREGSLIDLGVEQGIVRKAGAWYTYEGDQLGQGKENARNFLHDNEDLANEIEKKIKEKLGVGPRLDADASAPSAGPAGPAGQSPGPAGPVGPAGGLASVPTGPAAKGAGAAAGV
jgi:recombination protein RecA